MDYMCKVCLKGIDKNEYVTSVLVRDTTREDAPNHAISAVKRKPWLRLSDIELTRLIVTEVKTY